MSTIEGSTIEQFRLDKLTGQVFDTFYSYTFLRIIAIFFLFVIFFVLVHFLNL